MLIKLRNVRLSFPHLFKARTYEDGGDPKFTASFIYDPENSEVVVDKKKFKGQDGLDKLEEVIKEVAVTKFGKKLPKSLESCLNDGDKKDYDGYEGMFYVNASETKRPTLIDRDKTALAEEDGILYAGCYVVAILNLWVQDNRYGKKVNANLKGVQFLKDGEPFSAGDSDVTDEFDDESDDDDLM